MSQREKDQESGVWRKAWSQKSSTAVGWGFAEFFGHDFLRGFPVQCLPWPVVEQAGDVIEHGLTGKG